MKKRFTLLFFVVMTAIILTGCDSKTAISSTSKKEIPNLIGEWKQTNSDSEDAYQAATINDNEIVINWVSDNGATKALYWAGTYIAPTTDDETYVWDSENDHDQTDLALLASSDNIKKMTYEKGVLSYEMSALGTTTTVKLEKQ